MIYNFKQKNKNNVPFNNKNYFVKSSVKRGFYEK